jgi:hypothetical protein
MKSPTQKRQRQKKPLPLARASSGRSIQKTKVVESQEWQEANGLVSTAATRAAKRKPKTKQTSQLWNSDDDAMIVID